MEALIDIQKRLRAQMRTRAVGPVLVAQELAKLSANWGHYAAQAKGESLDAWVFQAFRPKTYQWFMTLNAAVLDLGQPLVKILDYQALRWTVCIPAGQRAEFIRRCNLRYKNGNHLTINQVRRIWAGMNTQQPKKVSCFNCALKQKEIDQLRIELAAAKVGTLIK